MRLGLITNGDRDLQFGKIEASGLASFFHVIAVSAIASCGARSTGESRIPRSSTWS